MQTLARQGGTGDTQIGARAALQAGFERIYSGVPRGRDWATYSFNQLRLGSHFQPIFSVAEKRCIAYEGLLLASNTAGQAVKPESVFSLSAGHQEELFLDWLCRALHLRNFANVGDEQSLVFLNAYPEAAIEDPHHPQVFREMIEFYGVNPANVVVEILETGASDEAKLVDAVRLYRSLGCRIAIDDFGIGFSNFDRLWRLHPDFVKIDRSVTASAVRETHARLVLANMVKLIHECGAQVIIEGIETRDEALTALEVGADFVQGFYFARPGLAAVPAALCEGMFAGLQPATHVAGAIGVRANGASDNMDVYVSALNLAILDLQRGATFAHATAGFRALSNVLRVYLATSEEQPTGGPTAAGFVSRLVLDTIESGLGLQPGSLPEGEGAVATDATSASRLRELLQAALANPRRVQIAPPAEGSAASGAGGALTLSCAFELESRLVVLCGDVRDRRLSATPSGSGRPGNVSRLRL